MKRFFVTLILISILFGLFTPTQALSSDFRATNQQTSGKCDEVTIHYRRRNADYEGWGLYVWGPTPLEGVATWESPLDPSGEDDFGIYWVVEVNLDSNYINYIIHRGNEKDPGPDQVFQFDQVGCEIWQVQGRLDQFKDPDTAVDALVIKITPSDPLAEDQVIIHYRRIQPDYDGWGIYIWGPTSVDGVTWSSPLMPSGQDEYGIYWIIDMQPSAKFLEYILHKGDQKDPGPDQKLDFEEEGHEIWLVQGSGEKYSNPGDAIEDLVASALGDIKNKAQAHWLTSQYIGWPVNFSREATYTLHYDPRGLMRVTPQGLQGGLAIPLEFTANTLSEELSQAFPHLWNARMLKIPDEYLAMIPDILKGQFVIRAIASDGSILGITALQIPGVLDDLYANNEPLGIVWEEDTPTLKVWAPTAKLSNLILFNEDIIAQINSGDAQNGDSSGFGRSYPMEWDPSTGIWSITGDPAWKGKFYQYEVEVFVREAGAVVTNRVTDPYAISLATNSTYSQIIDLSDPALIPADWDLFDKPVLENFTDIVLYELHVRDFSIRDFTVPEEQRGTYMAFTHPESDGMGHLSWLADQGVTHIHLLPVFDSATIDENKSNWLPVNWDQLLSFPPDSEEQQKIINEIRGQDGFNWGYDPYHFSVPEGSYSVHPQGYIRTLEFRKMVKALNQTGLRVVMDVVYNHTNASGQSDRSVLDRIVPGYYHRLDMDGQVTTSTCCQNTATEHAMMRKLMVDSIITWATAYKIDGFRFDLMGHHMKSDIETIRTKLNNLTFSEHGVDGSKIVIYGEGWDFGEVANNGRGINATQINMAGTGIGTFNDRLRDAITGGSPFGNPQDQGFATGLLTDPNEANSRSDASQLNLLLKLKDQIRIALAGNLADYQLINFQGETINGANVSYNGQPSGYTMSPQEHIAYASAHDNETLFDSIQYKAPLTSSLEDRLRMQSVALSLVSYSQGIPFFHAGSEFLRSKSMDRDSYDSTDWFNAIDWTFKGNNWGHGLPPKDKNGALWPIIQPLLGNPEISPGEEHMRLSRSLFGQLLKIRNSTPLFRLRTSEQIRNLVRFHNTGPDQLPGLIVMSISDDPSNPIDPNLEVVFVLFNADPRSVSFKLNDWQVQSLNLHPILNNDSYSSLASFDSDTQTFTVPGRSTIVFTGDLPIFSATQGGSTDTGAIQGEDVDVEIEITPEVKFTAQAEQPDPESGTIPPQETETSIHWAYWLLAGFLLIFCGGGAFYIKYFRNKPESSDPGSS